MQDIVLDMGGKLFAEHAEAAFHSHPKGATEGTASWQRDLWAQVEELGLPLALLSEEHGGFDLPAATAMGLVRLAAAYAIPLPLGETMIANWLLAHAGLPLAEGAATLALGPELEGNRLTGLASRVAYGRHAQTVVLLAGDRLVRTAAGTVADPSRNVAGEPRDTLTFAGEVASTASPVDRQTFRLLGALLRAQGMAGALEAALSMTVDYANSREQFGRPLGKFQAIQQSLAVMATNVAAAGAATEMATELLSDALTDTGTFSTAAMAAKIRTGEAAGIGASIAHQTHGAIGFSQEYRLHPLTRRLWAWRDEWGREAEWCETLGAAVCARGSDGFWPFLTSTGAAA
ncbi:acyl-CoA dehydrogenase family protein [Sulfitobacter sp. 1A12126]|uniref:acyl-CoA dehydrogenase family protein n=1 Tax=Sulfitobacter sp. 1A12126 TaxID=3368591 RepID=UPI0037454E9D